MQHVRPSSRLFILLAASIALIAEPARAADDYVLGPDSQPLAGAPRGTVHKLQWKSGPTGVFPGTERDYWVYVPAQYTAARPAALMVFQDGWAYANPEGQFRATVVLDNLIHKRELPVTVAVFVNPGTIPPAQPGQKARSNRSFEYDSLGDRYARFLVDELLPDVGKRWKLAADPARRAIVGISSGGICAFTAAWERPDQFGKVLSHIGSFVNIRGGHVYPSLIRKTERKPIRVFLQDGTGDLDNLHGSWPLANREMAAALASMGYDFKLEMGDGRHNGKHGGAILPDSLRWLWRSATPAAAMPLSADNLRGDEVLAKVLLDGEGWQQVAAAKGVTDAACADPAGNFYFADREKGGIQRVGADGKATVWLKDAPRIGGLAWGPDGRLYAATHAPKRQIIAIAPDTRAITVVVEEANADDLVVSRRGHVYFTDPVRGEVFLVDPAATDAAARVRSVATGMAKPNGLTFTPDGGTLAVSEWDGSHVWTFRVEPDGTLTHGAPWMDLRTPMGPLGARPDAGGDGMTVDGEGRFYVASPVGVQMFDWTGRMGGVIAGPAGRRVVHAAFAGPGRSYLYVCAGDRIYRRKMKAAGAASSP